MEHKLDDEAPDPGMLWLAIGIGVFSVLSAFVLAIYWSDAEKTSGSVQPVEVIETAPQG